MLRRPPISTLAFTLFPYASSFRAGSRTLRFPDFVTTAQDAGKVVSLSTPFTGLEWPRGFQEVKVPRFLNNGTGWW
jgi:hypothetical protein